MRRRSQRSTLVMSALALASGALVACSLLTGLDADYSSNARDGASAPSGEAGGSDAPGSDGGGMEGSTTDGMVTPDGGDGSVLSFCDQQRGDSGLDDFFCADFEQNDSVSPTTGPRGFEALVNNVDGGISISAGAGKDGTHALDVVSNTTNSALYRQLKVSKQFSNMKVPDQFKSYEMSFDFRVVASVVDYDAYALLVFGPTSPKENGIAGYGAAPAHQISREGPKAPAYIDNDAQWHSARVLLAHAAPSTPFARSIQIDQKDIENADPGHTFDSASYPTLSIGSFNTLNSAGLSHVQFDNVVVRRRWFP